MIRAGFTPYTYIKYIEGENLDNNDIAYDMWHQKMPPKDLENSRFFWACAKNDLFQLQQDSYCNSAAVMQELGFTIIDSLYSKELKPFYVAKNKTAAKKLKINLIKQVKQKNQAFVVQFDKRNKNKLQSGNILNTNKGKNEKNVIAIKNKNL